MAGNYYVRQTVALQSRLGELEEQAKVLEKENRHLREKEADLLLSVTTLSGGLHAQRRLTSSQCCPATSTSTTSSATSIDGTAATLGHLQDTEAQIQALLDTIAGAANAETQLYSTKLLDRVAADPKRVAAHLSLTRGQRLAYISQAVNRIGVLLPKYDLHCATSTGSPKAQLDVLVDELSERVLTVGLCDRHHLLSDCLINVETGQYELYPDGWWVSVIQAMQLSGEQKSALHTCWSRIKPIQLQLTAQHCRLANKLAALQKQQHQHQLLFKQEAEQVLRTAQEHQQQHLAQELLSEMQLLEQAQQPIDEAEAAADIATGWIEQQLVDSLSHQQQLSNEHTCTLGCEPSMAEPPCSDFAVAAVTALAAVSTARQASFPLPQPAAAAAAAAACKQDATSEFQWHQVQLAQPPVNQESRQLAALSPFAAAGACTAGDAAASSAAASTSRLTDAAHLRQAFLQQYAEQLQRGGSSALPQQQEESDYMDFAEDCSLDGQLDANQLRVLSCSSTSGPNNPFGRRQPPPQVAAGSGLTAASMAARIRPAASGPLPSQPVPAGAGGVNMAAAMKAMSMPLPLPLPSPLPTAATTSPSCGPAWHPGSPVREDEQQLFISDDLAPCEAVTQALCRATSQGQRELLLEVGSTEQLELEQRMAHITSQLKRLQFYVTLVMHNIFSRKQLALLYLHAFPFMPEAYSFCEALDDLGW